jgi:predicted nucleic acid-binding protein
LSGTLLDTDVLIDHLRGHRRLRLLDPDLTISVVTRCELFAARSVDEPILRQTLGVLEEIPVDRAIAESAGRVRRTTGIPVPDALIAATALEHGMSVMTRNRRHFELVPGLALRAPHD